VRGGQGEVRSQITRPHPDPSVIADHIGNSRAADSVPLLAFVVTIEGFWAGTAAPPAGGWGGPTPSSVTHGDVASMVMARRICSLVSRKLESDRLNAVQFHSVKYVLNNVLRCG